MNIIIAGAGKVGFNLAKALSIGHNVTIIDKNLEALYRIQESLDIMPLRGDVEDIKTYDHFTNKDIDLFIAVTNIGNVNIISILMANSVLNIKRRFVRLQQDFYNANILHDKLEIDRIIFPTKLASYTIASLLNYPKANNVKFFKYTDYRLISIQSLYDIQIDKINSNYFNVIGIERDKEYFIPSNSDMIKKDDLVYLFGLEDHIKTICDQFDHNENNQMQNCVVFGGEELGISISKALLDINKDVKLVEKDLVLCTKADEELQGKVTIINAKYGTANIFDDEGLNSADIFIAATNNDEYNIIKCLDAKERGIKKVVAINNELEYYNLMHSLGIIVTRGPKISAYNKIMEEISSSGVVIRKSYCGAKATVFMRKIFSNSKLINKKAKPIKLKNTLVLFIRNNILNLFTEKITLEQDDLIVGFCLENNSEYMKKWIYEL